jgi:hypothetical protein
MTMRADLHVHSRFSERPAHWLLKRLGCHESYTEPREVYRLAREKGMGLVTLTDHNSIDGCLKIADLPGTFVSEEVTTYFPDDRCKAHVLAYNITEAQHRDIQGVRENIFDLVDYLHREEIVHALAHPFFPVNERLTVERIEQLLLLFNVLEINGDQPQGNNAFLRQLTERLRREDIERLADKHGIAPRGAEPWRKRLVGGSDDHSSLYVARAHTEVEHARSPAEFLRGAADGAARVSFDPMACTPRAIAHGIYGIAYQFYKRKAGVPRSRGDLLSEVLDWLLEPPRPRAASRWAGLRRAWDRLCGVRLRCGGGPSALDALRDEVVRLLAEERGFAAAVKRLHRTAGAQTAWFHVVNRLSSRALRRFGDNVLDHFLHGNVFDLFQSLGAAGALYGALAPYFFAFSLHASQHTLVERARARLLPDTTPADRTVRAAHFTDSLQGIGGAAGIVRAWSRGGRELGQDHLVLGCAESADPAEGMRIFAPIGAYQPPGHPSGTLYYPPFLEMLDECGGRRRTHVHVATPGPVGLAGLGVARILRLPVIGTLHPAWLGQVHDLTEDGGAEEAAWRYLAWFYNQTDLVLAQTKQAARQLVAHGVSRDRVLAHGPGFVHADLFHEAARRHRQRNHRPGAPQMRAAFAGGPVEPARGRGGHTDEAHAVGV